MPDLSPEEVRALVDAVPYWHHIMHFPHGISSPGVYDPRELFSFLELPDLRGKRVLDVGTRDGFFAFECERRGAEVVVLDYAQFLPVGRYHSDSTNKWVPNVDGLRALLADALFDPGPAFTWGDRSLIHSRPIVDAGAQKWVEIDRGLRKR